jgi:ATP-dependent helicase HrpA
MLERQARELAKTISEDATLLLGAAPFFTGDALVDVLLQLAFRHTCFDGPPCQLPRTRAAFESAVDRARGQLHASVAQFSAMLAGWCAEARAVRRLLDDPRARPHGAAVEETHAHLVQLLNAATIESLSPDWLRQVSRYLKAEERRWQRIFARGAEPPQILREIKEWTSRHEALARRVSAELRWLPQLDELRCWIEEYRVSLYAQELKTLGPVSAARLEERAVEIAEWISR